MEEIDREWAEDARERYTNLLEAYAAKQLDEVVALEQLDEIARIAGPVIGGINAAGICAEALARWLGMNTDEIAEIDGNPNVPVAFEADPTSSPEVALHSLLSLHQAVVNDLTELTVYTPSSAGTAEPSAGREEEWHWIKVGTNPVYCAIAGEIAIAIVYQASEEMGTDEEGEPIVTDPGWFWFPLDRPKEHATIDVPEPVTDEGRGSLDPVHDAALEAAAEQIEAYFGLAD